MGSDHLSGISESGASRAVTIKTRRALAESWVRLADVLEICDAAEREGRDQVSTELIRTALGGFEFPDMESEST